MKVEIGPYGECDSQDNKIQIDDYDIWSLDYTLSLIIAPALKKIKGHGAGFIPNEDVPENLHGPEHSNMGEVDDNWFPRWEWVLDEMIWAFESLQEKEDPKYGTPEYDAYFDRQSNGFRLFGKYYRSLWT